MPFVISKGYRFGFYSLDQDESPHTHVFRGGNEAKIWLRPVEPEWNHGYNQREVGRILELTRQQRQRL